MIYMNTQKIATCPSQNLLINKNIIYDLTDVKAFVRINNSFFLFSGYFARLLCYLPAGQSSMCNRFSHFAKHRKMGALYGSGWPAG
jgi:hypothetical protein